MSLPRRQTPVHPRAWAPGSPLAVRFIVCMLAGWAASQFTLWAFGIPDVREALQLDDAAMREGEFWRLFTHQLFHSGPLHFFLNMLVFTLAGREVEPIVGRGPFVSLCLAAGLIGGMADWAVPGGGTVFGFSAATAAVLAAHVTILPEIEHRVRLLIFGEVRLRARLLVAVLIVLCTAALVTRTHIEAGPAGILTGCVTGWLWARWQGFGRQLWLQRRKTERRERELRLDRMDPEEFIAGEVDPILEKIARSGIGSLTRAERRLLEQGSAKLTTPRRPRA